MSWPGESGFARLRDAGFRAIEAHDLSQHLKTSYECLVAMAQSHGYEHEGKYQTLAYAYRQMVQAIDNDELGWGLYLYRK